MKTIDLSYLRTHIDQIAAGEFEEPIVITNNGTPVTMLVPLQSMSDEQFNLQVGDQVKKVILKTVSAKTTSETRSTEEMKRSIGVRPDIVITKDADRVIAVVEVEYLKRITTSDAISMRRHLLFDKGKSADYFFLITPDLGFVWDQKTNKDPGRKPDLRFSVKDSFKLDLQLKEKRVDKAIAFEEAVTKWFSDVTSNENSHSAAFETPLLRDVATYLKGSEVHVAS